MPKIGIDAQVFDKFWSVCRLKEMPMHLTAAALLTDHYEVFDEHLVEAWFPLPSAMTKPLMVTSDAWALVDDLAATFDCSREIVATAILAEHLPILMDAIDAYPDLLMLSERYAKSTLVAVYNEIMVRVKERAAKRGVAIQKMAQMLLGRNSYDVLKDTVNSQDFQQWVLRRTTWDATPVHLGRRQYVLVRDIAVNAPGCSATALVSYILEQELDAADLQIPATTFENMATD